MHKVQGMADNNGRALKIALAQVNPIVGDLVGNAGLALAMREKAAALSADLVVFPELFITGYPPEDLDPETGLPRGARARSCRRWRHRQRTAARPC